jgi:AcrR family transcriptional regulator
MVAPMSGLPEAKSERKSERRTRQRAANRAAILDAARRVVARTELGEIALRAVAAEAGYAPASVYEYFRNRAELVLALAADDLAQLARALKEIPSERAGIANASRTALDIVRASGALAASSSTFEDALPPEAERMFNGKLIAALSALAEAAGRGAPATRDEQADVVLIAAAIAGLAMFARAGRLKALGFEEEALLERLEKRFA